MFRFLVIISFLFISVACSRLTGNVQSFSTLSDTQKTATLIVRPYPENLQNSLEYKSYKVKLETHLKAQGFNIVQSENQAELIAFFHYGIDDGVEIRETNFGYPHITYGGSIGTGGNGHIGARYTMPIYHSGSTTTQVYDSYNRKIALDIVIADSLGQESGPTILYEGRLRSKGRCGVLSEVIDEMLTILFEKFPDQSGRVSIEQKADC